MAIDVVCSKRDEMCVWSKLVVFSLCFVSCNCLCDMRGCCVESHYTHHSALWTVQTDPSNVTNKFHETFTASTFYSQLVTWCTTSLTFNNCTLCSHCICVFLFISEQTANCVPYNLNWLISVTEMKSVYSAVRTGSLNKAVCASSLKG